MITGVKVEVEKGEPVKEITMVAKITMTTDKWKQFAEEVQRIDSACPFNILKDHITAFVENEIGS